MREIRPAIVLFIALTALTGIVYPFTMTGVAQLLFPWQANGSLINKNGTIIGSRLIGQSFTSPRYFHGRPSATTETNAAGKTIDQPYNAANSGGSNLGPTSRRLVDHVEVRAEALAKENPGAPIPVDLVTSSGSGLDPDITPAGALFQVPAVAKARGLPVGEIRKLVEAHITPRLFGIIGEPHVNVLNLNLSLDKLATDAGSKSSGH